MVTQAKRRSNDKWDRANMIVLSCKVRRDYSDRLRAVCEARGDTINGVIRAALDRYLEQYEDTEQE